MNFKSNIFFGFFLVFLNSCSNDLEEAKKLTKSVDTNVELGHDVKIDYTEYGVLKAQLKTTLLQRFTVGIPRTEFPKGVHLEIFGLNKSIENTLDADFGMMDDVQHVMIAKSNVRVVNNKGDLLNAEELIWNQNEKKIYSNGFVKITTAKEIIYGDTLIADEKFTNYSIKKVKGTVHVKK